MRAHTHIYKCIYPKPTNCNQNQKLYSHTIHHVINAIWHQVDNTPFTQKRMKMMMNNTANINYIRLL